MQAIRIHAFGEADVLKLEMIPDPVPAAGQVLIEVHAIGVNPVDTYIRAGKYGPREFPFTPGSDAAGLVLSVGEGVKVFKPGDRVYTGRTISGAYAEKTVADQFNVYPLPESVTFQRGAALGIPYGTAFRALFFRGHARPAETVLIHGASGSVGSAATQMAHALGCTIIGTAGSDKGRQLVREQGAQHALDHHAPDYLKKVMNFTGGKGVDLILEMLANVNLGKDLTVLAKQGRVVVVGSRGKVELDPRDTMSREADIRGMTLMAATNEELRSTHAYIHAGLEAKTLNPILDKELSLARAAEAHVDVLKGDSHGKIVLKPQ
jgi:NADPH2:quinone reductase